MITFVCFMMTIIITFCYVAEAFTTPSCPSVCICKKTTLQCNNSYSLSYIPKVVSSVEEVYFSSNNLSRVNYKTMINLTNLHLTKLVLRNNSIHTLENDAFSGLKSLRYLDLSENRLLSSNHISDAFDSITSIYLQTVVLSGFKWKSQPRDIYITLATKSFQIKRLILRDNDFRTVQIPIRAEDSPYIYTLPEITDLDFSFNSIHKVRQLNPTTHLKEINMNYNSMRLPRNFFGKPPTCLYPNLVRLHLVSNFISSFKSRFRCLQNLKELHVGKNPVKILKNHDFLYLPVLEILTLRSIGKRLYKIGKFAFNISTLRSLDFSENDFKFDPHGEKLGYFHPDHIFNYLPELESLDLSQNQFNMVSNIFSRMLKPLQFLKKLTIKNAELTFIPSNFLFNLPNLQLLDLSKNHIKYIDGRSVFRNSSLLETLILQENFLAVIDDSSIPDFVCASLLQIDLSSNPFTCSCNNLWFRKWIAESPTKFKNYPVDYTCRNPPEMKDTLLQNYFPSDSDCSDRNVLLTIFILLCTVGIFFVTIMSLVYKARWHIRHGIYLLRMKRKGYTEIKSTDFLFEAFVIYSYDDNDWVRNKLIPNVESDDIRLCIHHRDFLAGKIIVDNIAESMIKSKRVVLILSPSMMKSEWCLFEMRIAQRRFLNKEDTLLIIMLKHVLKTDMPRSLHELLLVATYIEWPGDDSADINIFWTKIKRALKY